MASGGECEAGCQALVGVMLAGEEPLCKDGDLAMIDADGKTIYSTANSKVLFPIVLPTCIFPFPTDGEVDEWVSESETAAPTMAPIRTVVEAEVTITMSKTAWEEKGEAAFKKSIAASVGCGVDDVDILSVKGGVEERRTLRSLAVSALEVEFAVDVTQVVSEQVDADSNVEESDIIAELVEDVAEKVEGGGLVADIAADTGETVEVEVVKAPKETEVTLEVDNSFNEKLGADVHDQSGGAEWFYDCYENKEGGSMRCAPVYAPVAIFMVGLMCCLLSCALRCCSKEERRAKAERKHLKAKNKQSTRDFEMPKMRDSSMSSADPDAFQGVNPMSSGGPGGLLDVRGGGGKPKTDWIELVDEGSGRQYFENLKTGETAWEPPKEGYRNRLCLLAEKKTGGR
jgi:hypothetical protein